MTIEVEVPAGGHPADLVATSRGELSLAAETVLREQVHRACPARPGARLLLDYSAREPAGFGAGDARVLGDTMPGFRRSIGPGVRIALVADTPAVFGCLRMVLTYAELAEEQAPAPPGDGATQLFASRAEAVAWLGAPVCAP